MNDMIIGEKVGTISIDVYKETITNGSLFYVKSENEDVLPVLYVIEDTLKLY